MGVKYECEDKFSIENKHISSGAFDGKPMQNPVDFETAISATKFGKFNIILMVIGIPAYWSVVLTTSVTSFIAPFAECDLNLSLQDKGLLNAIVFAGMVSGGYLWGFLSDALGRRKILIITYLLNGFFVLLCGSSQNFNLLLFGKFMDGFTISGPFAIFPTVLSEFHSAKHRAKIIMLMGIVLCSTSVIVPAVGSIILTSIINVELFNGFMVWHSWNIFVLVSSLPSLVSGVGVWVFMPETPKFLMAKGQNTKALEVFRNVYSWNTGENPGSFPIKILVEEKMQIDVNGNANEGSSKKLRALKDGLEQLKPLFRRPLGVTMLLVASIHFGMLAGMNMFRMWLPQIFTAMNEYHVTQGYDSDLCTMLETTLTPSHPKNATTACLVNTETSEIFHYAMVPPVFSIIFYFLTGILVNKLGKKNIYFLCGIVSGTAAIFLYFSTTTAIILTLASLSVSMSSVCAHLMVAIIVDLFPTTLRSLSISLMMCSGRIGSMIGSVLFPILLEGGCLPPFLTVGVILIVVTLVMTLIPKTDLKALE